MLASLVHEARTAASGKVVTMFCRRMAVIHKKARGRLEEIRAGCRAESGRLLGVFGDVLVVVRDVVRPAKVLDRPTWPVPASTREWAGGLEQLAAAHEAISAHHGDIYLPLLEGFYRSYRSALFTLLETVELEATSAERADRSSDAARHLG